MKPEPKIGQVIRRIQNLPESKRKIILWSVMIIVGLLLLNFYIENTQERLKSFQKEEFKEELQLPSLKKEIEDLLKIKMPNIRNLL